MSLRFEYSFDFFANILGLMLPEDSSFSRYYVYQLYLLLFVIGIIYFSKSLTFFSTNSTTLLIYPFLELLCGEFQINTTRLLSCPPPVKPISVCAASPGPLTTHPIIDKFIGFFI